MVTPQEKAHNVYPGSLKQNRTFRLGEDTGLLLVCKKSTITFKKFIETRSVLDAVRRGRPRTSAENIESERQAFSCSPVTN